KVDVGPGGWVHDALAPYRLRLRYDSAIARGVLSGGRGGCALPNTVRATNGNATYAVRKCFLSNPPLPNLAKHLTRRRQQCSSGPSRRVRPKCESSIGIRLPVFMRG